MITGPGLAQMGINKLAKRHQVIEPEHAPARGNSLEVVDAAKRRPGNRHAHKDRTDRTIHKVANHRHAVHCHTVMDLQRVPP